MADSSAEREDPLFALEGPVWRQSETDDRVVLLAAANRMIALVTARGRLVRLNSTAPAAEREEHELGLKADDVPISLSLDSTGQLLIVSTRAGECFAHAARASKPRAPLRLTKTRGTIIECSAWVPTVSAAGATAAASSATSSLLLAETPSREVLVGTSAGSICELSLSDSGKERAWRVLLTLAYAPAQPICALAIELANGAHAHAPTPTPSGAAAQPATAAASGAAPRAGEAVTASPPRAAAGGLGAAQPIGGLVIFAATATRLFGFSGGSAEAALGGGGGGVPSGSSPERGAAHASPGHADGHLLLELPSTAGPAAAAAAAAGATAGAQAAGDKRGAAAESQLEVFGQPAGGRAQAIAWGSHAGIYHAKLAPTTAAAAGAAGGAAAGARATLALVDARLLPPELATATSTPAGTGAARAAGAASAIPAASTPQQQRPLALGCLEFQLLLAWPHEVRAVSVLSDRVECAEGFEAARRRARGGPAEPFVAAAYDRARGARWLATSGAVFLLRVRDEARHVWAHYLSRAEFESALAFCTTAAQRERVLAAQADAAAALGQLHSAAVYYARLGGARPFEEIALRLLSGGGAGGGSGGSGGGELRAAHGAERARGAQLPRWAHPDSPERALITFLSHKLDHIPDSSKTQLTMACTWLTELLLAALDRATAHAAATSARAALRAGGSVERDGDGASAAAADAAEAAAARALCDAAAAELASFLVEQRGALDVATTADLLAAHGAVAHLDAFCEAAGDVERLVAARLRAGDAPGALRALRARRAPADAPLHYRHAHALLCAAPDATVDSWLEPGAPPLEPSKLLPTIAQWLPPLPAAAGAAAPPGSGGPDAAPAPSGSADAADAARARTRAALARYLERVVSATPSPSSAARGALLLLLVHARDEPAVERLIVGAADARRDRAAADAADAAAEQSLTLDLLHALRVCEAYGLERARARALIALRLWDDALGAALALGDVALAKAIARGVDERAARARLWQRIARHHLGGAAVDGADGGAGGGGAAGVAAALALIAESSGALSLDALLPLLPETASIDELREPMIRSLDAYAAEIDQLTALTDESAAAAESAREELGRQRGVLGALRPWQRCALSGAPLDEHALRAGGALLFACGHAFERQAARRRLAELKRINTAAVGPRAEEEECVLCGDAMIDSLRAPLVDLTLDTDRFEAELWRTTA